MLNDNPLVLTLTALAKEVRAAGYMVRSIDHPAMLLDRNGKPHHDIAEHGRFVIVIPEGGEDFRDTIAINLGDERCRWTYAPADAGGMGNAIALARPMWADEVATIDDIPDPGEIKTYASGFDELDRTTASASCCPRSCR
jgi:hypothetical protein